MRQQIAVLASGGFLTEARTSCCSDARHRQDPPGQGLGIAAAHHGHGVLFATATERVTPLTDTHRAGRLPKSSPDCGATG